jgi:aminomethyltransferase
LDGLEYFRLVEEKLAGVSVQLSRTGYTGDLGYEIFVDAVDAERLWDTLMEVGRRYGLHPAGNTALDMVRIEAGLLLIDVDFISCKKTLFEVEKSTPYELGLGWLVRLQKEYFVGQDALRREQAGGTGSRTVGLLVDVVALEKLFSRFSMPLSLPYTSWNDAVPIYADADQRQHIGKATSGTWSPILKKYPVIARVKPQYAEPGKSVFLETTVEGQRFAVPATVVKMPFFDPPRKKA